MKELKELVEKLVKYTRVWSITETEWYWNVESARKSETCINGKREEHITTEEFERAIREEFLYDLIYRIERIKMQLENDYMYGYEGKEKELFEKESKEIEKEIQKYYKDFKIGRV